jgi:ERCC4-type nuclease
MIGESDFIKSFLANETIIVDTREKKPYTFDGFTKARIVAHKLPFGDYSVRGFERDIIVERKTLEDYIGSITNNRQRFIRELMGISKKYAHSAIVVEGNWSDILGIPDSTGHSYLENHPGINPTSLISTTLTIQCNLGIPVFFAGDRIGAQIWTLQFLARSWKELKKTQWENSVTELMIGG